MIKKEKKGLFSIASTHLGRIEDTPLRTLQLLHSADIIIFEEAREGRKLLKQAKTTRKYYIYNEHKDNTVTDHMKESLLLGKHVLYVSDQGCPTLCDPGTDLVKLAHQTGAKIEVIPGPSSLTAALSACPFYLETHIFAGFLPRKRLDLEKKLKNYLTLGMPIVIFETPYRRNKLLETCQEIIKNKRKVYIALDISGQDESYYYGSCSSVFKKVENLGKLNFVLIIEGTEKKSLKK